MRFRSPQPSRGFALLITITLLAFLVLLLVSLATLTRVETQVATNNQLLNQARQNALMALNIALGQLQKYTGPDQRTTARSDMDLSLANTTTASGRWTGVYGRGVATADTAVRDIYTDIPSKIATDVKNNSTVAGNQTQLLNWLVSGNEGASFNPDPASASATIDYNGQIVRPNTPASFSFTPAGAVTNLTGATALSTDITITGSGGAAPARLLVGPQSVTAASDYVVAPLVDIAVAPNIALGIGGSSNVTLGRYAWWVGDEGIKARINLPVDPAVQASHAFVLSQRTAIELIDGKNAGGSTTALASDLIGAAYPAPNNSSDQDRLKNVTNRTQLPMLSPANANLATAVKYRFHDLTGYSASILSDAYAGGLKKDLSAVLGTNHGATTPADASYLFVPEPNTAGSTRNEFGLPTWGQLRSFVQTTTTSAGLAPRLPTMASSSNSAIPLPTNVGIAPVMTYGVVGFQYIAPLGDNAVNNPIQLAMLPIVVLWNPYTVPIRGASYEFGIRKQFGGNIQLQGREAGSAATWSANNVLETIDLGSAGSTSYNPAYFRFIIDNSAGIPPGQSLVFTLSANGAAYNGRNTLTNGYRSLNYVLLPARSRIGVRVGSETPQLPGGYYRVGVKPSFSPDPFPAIPVTYFPAALGGGLNMGYGNWHQVYLGAVSPVAGPFPTGDYPWTGASFTTQKWYQSYTALGRFPNIGQPPYGVGSAGYAASSGPSGLVQPEARLSAFVSAPAWRILIFNQFSQAPSAVGRARWMVNGNVRGLMCMDGGENFTGQPTVNDWPPDLSAPDTGLRTSSGTSLNDVSGPVDTTLFEFRPDTMPLLTIGQLQHASLGWNAGWPGYAIGNSNSGRVTDPDKLVVLGALNSSSPALLYTARYYDFSSLLNRALWDRYFVSTIPYAGTGTSSDTDSTGVPPVLPNSRHILYNAKLADLDIRTKLNVDQAAAHLLLSGGFNINSTSEQAWRAILGGSNQLNYDPTGTATGGSAWPKAVFSRFSKPTTNATLTNISNPNATADAHAAWLGYRQLNEEQIAQFATNIVAEIRKRGPFVSLADFINRRLVASGVFPQANDPRLKGTIQAALDATISGPSAINDGSLMPFSTNLVTGGYGNNPNTNAFTTGNSAPATPVAPYGSATAFAPQFLTQADVLSSIGSGLSARSDTFTIRTYGETVNPTLSATDAGYITGRAWCEAVVQRLPDYVDSSTDANAYNSPTATINKTMGRRYKIISFQWLSANDI